MAGAKERRWNRTKEVVERGRVVETLTGKPVLERGQGNASLQRSLKSGHAAKSRVKLELLNPGLAR